ncbi:hypothetical protein KSP40_PGU021411 [Platanthera guangdongensis]|uniref:Uncharacterized protein n=1 Tax=Platanthera guangdongensis TaxID=2320717 RepID=A0ABR2LLU0_9ASPA
MYRDSPNPEMLRDGPGPTESKCHRHDGGIHLLPPPRADRVQPDGLQEALHLPRDQ